MIFYERTNFLTPIISYVYDAVLERCGKYENIFCMECMIVSVS